MFHRATKIKYRKGTALELTFMNGKTFYYDVSEMFDRHPYMRALNDRHLFLSGHLDPGGYGVIWTDDLDMSVEVAYHEGSLIKADKSKNVRKVSFRKMLEMMRFKRHTKKR